VRLDHVQLAAPPGCEEAARAFYGALLGLPEIPKPAPMRSELDALAARLRDAGAPVEWDDRYPGSAASPRRTRAATGWSC
jgi:catechol 2,3-dioxygenase-like lactoylglutathione lyase family enzyme